MLVTYPLINFLPLAHFPVVLVDDMFPNLLELLRPVQNRARARGVMPQHLDCLPHVAVPEASLKHGAEGLFVSRNSEMFVVAKIGSRCRIVFRVVVHVERILYVESCCRKEPGLEIGRIASRINLKRSKFRLHTSFLHLTNFNVVALNWDLKLVVLENIFLQTVIFIVVFNVFLRKFIDVNVALGSLRFACISICNLFLP